MGGPGTWRTTSHDCFYPARASPCWGRHIPSPDSSSLPRGAPSALCRHRKPVRTCVVLSGWWVVAGPVSSSPRRPFRPCHIGRQFEVPAATKAAPSAQRKDGITAHLVDQRMRTFGCVTRKPILPMAICVISSAWGGYIKAQGQHSQMCRIQVFRRGTELTNRRKVPYIFLLWPLFSPETNVSCRKTVFRTCFNRF